MLAVGVDLPDERVAVAHRVLVAGLKRGPIAAVDRAA